MTELFHIPETPSPRLRWMQEHDVKTIPGAWDSFTERERWAAYAGSIDDMPELYYGDTADDAITEFAKANNIRLWNEEGVR